MIPSTYLGLSRVCLISEVLGCILASGVAPAPWAWASLPAEVCWDVCVLVIRLHRLHLRLTVGFGSSGPFSSSEEAPNAEGERDTHTHVRLVSGPRLLDLLYHHCTYHHFHHSLERCWEEGDRILRFCLLLCPPFLVFVKSPFCPWIAKPTWGPIVFPICAHFMDFTRVKFSYLCSNSLLPLFFFLSFFYFYFWLRWVFIAARGLSLVAASGGYSSFGCAGFPLRWLLL